MLLIPYRTDAPVYHWPIATVALIVVNILAQILQPWLGEDTLATLTLTYGTIAPWQWLTSVFLHAGWLHLIGNLIFLWVFGLVVEGKLGWWRFLLLYLTIGALSGAIEQVIMLGATGDSLGASGVLFGLMAIALVWAPDNEIDCVLLLLDVRQIELRIRTVAWIYIALQVLGLMLDGWHFGTAALHLLGAGVGLPLGVALLRLGWVDCEGWDWFSRHRRAATAPLPRRADPGKEALEREHVAAITGLVEAGAATAAWSAYQANRGDRLPLPPALRRRLADDLTRSGRAAEAAQVLTRLLADAPGDADLRLLRAEQFANLQRDAELLADLDAIAAPTAEQTVRIARLRAEAEQRGRESPFA